MSSEKPEVVVSAKVTRDLATMLKEQAEREGRSASAQMAELIKAANGVDPVSKPLKPPARLTRAAAADRATFLMEQLSALVGEVERTDPAGARLLIGSVSSACWSWQSDRLNRTELLTEALDRLHAVINSAPGQERGSLMVTTLNNIQAKAAKLLGDKA